MSHSNAGYIRTTPSKPKKENQKAFSDEKRNKPKRIDTKRNWQAIA